MEQKKRAGGIRVDLKIIADMIEPENRVLDVGCGDGELLAYLNKNKQTDGRGLEISVEGVQRAVSEGIPVIKGDADKDLEDYPSDAFDYVILSHTLQATFEPKKVLENLVRIGKHVIVSIPNFGHWRVRMQLLLKGRMPVTKALPYQWWETPNIHFCSIKDFIILCEETNISIDRFISINSEGSINKSATNSSLVNFWAKQAVFLLHKNQE